MTNHRLQEIYDSLGENICLYPFFGAFYQTNNVVSPGNEGSRNSVRPCSIVRSDDMQKWDIENDSVQASRNSTAWIQMRKDFSQGKLHTIGDCRDCSYNEKSGTTSPRQMNNKFYSEFLSIDIVKEVKDIIDNEFKVRDIITLDYYPSNYCNYQCVMCAGGASSQRLTYEIKILNRQGKIELNSPDPDFYDVLNRVEIINFTGGETVLQKQVHDIMDYLISKGISQRIMITLLTNASSDPDRLLDKFRQFKKVIYNVSIDGVGEVIEYQRRGCSWPTVETNSLKLMHHDIITCVINYVLTGINVLNFMDFIDWAFQNNIGPQHENDTCQYITISPVFRVEHLGMASLPPALRDLALSRLRQGRARYDTRSDVYARSFLTYIDRVISVIETTPFDQKSLDQFLEHIRSEDSVSKKTLVQVVPEWAPYFN